MEDALSVAQYGDEIWVAKGIYKPATDDDRNKSFQWLNGVGLYGGFEGFEISKSARDWNLNETILSGDIGTPGLQTDNSLHVLKGEGLNHETLLDGFTICDGYAADIASSMGGGLLLLGLPTVSETNPRIYNCRFVNNTARSGGAIAMDWMNPEYPNAGPFRVNITLKSCLFQENRSYLYGGGIYRHGGAKSSDTLRWEDCKFIHNISVGALPGMGGGLCFVQPGSTALYLLRCYFERDSSYEGGGIAINVQNDHYSAPSLWLDSCRFKKNWALNGGGISFLDFESSNHENVNFTLLNCAFEEGIAYSSDGAAFYLSFSNQAKLTAKILRCLFIENKTRGYPNGFIDVYLNSEASIDINDCIFAHNKNLSSINNDNFQIIIGGGGNAIVNKLNTVIKNCLFYNNGGGVAVIAGYNDQALTTISNCSFYKNNFTTFVKSWHNEYEYPASEGFDSMIIRNCIIWEPDASAPSMFYSNDPSNQVFYGFNIDRCLINFQETSFSPYAKYTSNLGNKNVYALDPLFVGPDAGDFQLKHCSPAVDKGDNVFSEDLIFDLAQKPRIRFGKVDFGAYESQDSCTTINVENTLETKSLSISPCPSAGILMVDLPGADAMKSDLCIFDHTGRPVYQLRTFAGERLQLDLAGLPAGLYRVFWHQKDALYMGHWIRI